MDAGGDKQNFDCEYYLPMMAVSYGGNASSPVADGGRQVVFLAMDNGISGGKKSYYTMTAVGLDTGDVDGDGTDEIVVGGTKNTVTSKANSADCETAYALDRNIWNVAVFNARSDGSFASPGTDDSVTHFHSIDATGWFAGGTGGKYGRSPLSLACVAFNGSINAEYVFMGGKIIDFSTGGANELYTVSFVKDNDDSVQSTICDQTFIPSVAVGNFDGNDYGYEQIFFVYSNRESGDDDYFYRLGAVGGKNYDGNGGGVGSAGGTDTSMFYEKSSGFFMGGSTGQGGAGAGGNWNYNTNFVLVSMDRDDDGVLARYKGKNWTYTDPRVAAVLQMAPYFDGIDLGSDSGETTYSFTQSYEYTKGTGDETSFGVGFAGEVETNFVTVELQVGSSNTWTETFEETLTTSTTDSFATKAYDSVVLQRTPVITYTYEIYDKSKGGWSWDDLESTEEGTGFAISVPKPGYAITEVTLTTEEGTETVTPVDGQFNFAIQEATTITVTAAVVAEESIVSYTANDDHGTVSATVNGEAFPSTGATFGSDDEIIFTAAPADGYALKEWKVTDGSGTHGTISAAAERKGMELYDDSKPSVVYEDGTITFTAAPDEGYRVKEWIVNGVVQPETGNTLTLTPMQDLNVTVQYTSGLPKVSFADPAHGTLTAKMGEYSIESGAAVSGPVTFTVVPDEHYEVKCWTVNGVEQPGETGNTFTYAATDDCTVAVELWGMEQQVTLKTGTGGTASATDPARYGETITITATPDANYMVKAWTINGEVVEGNLTNTLTIDSLGENTTVTVEFETYQGFVVPAGGEGYTVTIDQRNPADTYPGAPENEIRRGGDVTFTVAPAADSAIKTVTVAREDATITPNGDGTVTVFIPNVQEEIGLTVDILAGIPLTIETAENGTVTVTRDGVALKSGVKVVAGDKLVITGQPDSGYRLSTLTVNGKNFTSGSTYTVAETDTALTVAATFEVQSSGGGGGGGGGGVSSYKITVEDSDHGTVVADRNSANADTTVTLTVTPDDGYRLDSLTVTQQDGKTITLDEEKDGTYTFTMPDSAVTVKAAFTEVTQIELPFVDVPADIWYEDGVYYVYRHGLMDGTSSITFSPDMTTTRSMVATILWRLEGSPVVDYAVPFDDVDLDSWYGEAVRWAASEGIITGYGNNKFGPDDLITREQMATMLHRYAQYKGYDVSIGENTNILSYTDAADVGEYAIPAMQWAVGAEIINGTSDRTLSPEGDATRAEVAVILMRFCEGLVDE
ncbi:InlB B-repeat-containing protein [Flavonifractor sp. An91]|uniref:InlB B-repeat-containing protein n=1 Tax=Flavonifractor sp. An91 TaxID=1965665 RepID=UPI001121B87F|nr:S-layer homology domain-containing protein [Flavonifractor sp. An91]